MSKNYDASWESALTVVQEAPPPFIPEGAHAMTVVIDYPREPPAHRRTGIRAARPSDTCWRAKCCSNWRACAASRCAGEAFWEPGGDVIRYSDGNARDDVRVRFVVTMLCVPGQPMLVLVGDDEFEHAGTFVWMLNQTVVEEDGPISKILLHIRFRRSDDWDISRFSLLADELRVRATR